MKKVYTLFFAVFVTAVGFAQSPQKMSYQAVIRNTIGELLKSSPIGMKISILQGSETGTPVYVETHTTTTNSNGLVTIEIGGGTPVTGTFAGIDWSAGTYFIKTETDPTGGTNYTILGISQLLSVPYALYAKISETSGDVGGLKQQIKILEDNLIAAGTYKLADVEGNQYNVVKIGTQVWMKENLQTTRYSNGDVIGTTIPSTLDISLETTPKYQWAYGGNESNVATYGRLYTWFAVTDSRNVCPTGWHLPTDAEWTILTTYLGGQSVAGGKLKETGTNHWQSPNTGASNETGFTALPGGYRYNDGNFYVIGYNAFWWSSTESSSTDAYDRSVFYLDGIVLRNGMFKHYGYSVRCLRDL